MISVEHRSRCAIFFIRVAASLCVFAFCAIGCGTPIRGNRQAPGAGRTEIDAFFEAIDRGDGDCIKSMIGSGRININDVWHSHPLWFYAIHGRNPEMCELLLNMGADLGAVARDGSDSLAAAIGTGDLDTVICILRAVLEKLPSFEMPPPIRSERYPHLPNVVRHDQKDDIHALEVFGARILGINNDIIVQRLVAGARNGNPDAMYEVGLAYATGEGVKRDFIEAETWLKKAEEAGIATAAQALRILLREAAFAQDGNAGKFLHARAEGGDPAAKFYLGLWYRLNGDMDSSKLWSKSAADAGFIHPGDTQEGSR